MVDSIFAFLDKFTFNLTTRSFSSLLLLLFVVAVSFYGYERFTNTFQLSRLERTTALLKELEALQPNLNRDSTLVPIYRAIQKDVLNILESPPTPLNLSPTLLRGLAAATPWFLITLIFSVSVFKGTSPPATIFGGLLFAIIFGLSGMLLPASFGSDFNYLLYPIGHFLIVAAITFLWQRRKKKAA